MIIEQDLLAWLNSMAILSTQQNTMVKSVAGQSGQSTVGGPLMLQFENGIIFGKLALKLIGLCSKNKINGNVQIDVQQLKDLNSPAAKLFNWNKLQDIFRRHLNVVLDQDLKSLIIAGDADMIRDFLKEVHGMYANLPGKRVNTNSSQAQLENKSKVSKAKPKQETSLSHKEMVDFQTFDPSRDIAEAECLLEFMLLVLCKNLELKAKQGMSLLTNSGKYLAHILVKGVKGQFEPVLGLFQDCYTHSEKVVSLFQMDTTKESLTQFFTIMVPGVLSKSSEVALWCGNLLQKLALESMKVNLFTDCCQWFFTENQGFSCIVMGMKRHYELTVPFLSTLQTYGRYNFLEMLTILLRQQLENPSDYLPQIRRLVRPLKESSVAANEQQSVIQEWLQWAMNQLRDFEWLLEGGSDGPTGYDTRLLGQVLGVLTEIWLLYPDVMDTNEDNIAQVIRGLKAGANSNYTALQLSAVTFMFSLLEQFGKQHSNYAPYIYKTLTIVLVENYNDVQLRQYMSSQFKWVFESVEGIPMAILVEPFLKTIAGQDQSYFQRINCFDLEFLLYLAQSSKLQLKNAISFLELMAKIYYHSITQASLCGTAMLSIIMRNLQQEVVQQFAVKFTKVGLAMFFASERKKKLKEKQLLPMYNARNSHEQSVPQLSAQELDQEMISAQKRSLIVEIIRQIVRLEERTVNDKVKALVAHTNIQLKQQGNKKNNKAMINLLNEFGNGEQIAKEYDGEYQEQQKRELEQQQSMSNRQLEVQSVHTQHTQYSSQKGLQHNRSEQPQENDIKTTHHQVSLGQQVFQVQPAGVGKQGVSTRLTTEEQTQLQKKLNMYKDPKVRRQLNGLYDQKRNREDLKQQLINAEKMKAERVQQSLRSKLEKRSQEQGINIPIRGTSGRKDEQQRVLLYSYDSRKDNRPQIQIVGVDQQEKGEIQLVEGVFKQYQKLIVHLFGVYAQSGFSVKNRVATFDQLKERVAVISINELYALLKEHGYQDKVSLEDTKILTRLVNTSQSRTQLDNLPLEGFKQFLLQLGVHVYPIQGMPVSCALQQLINDFRNQQKIQGKSVVLYDDPQGIASRQDRVLVDQYNRELQYNPQYSLPEGYRVHTDKKHSMIYEMPISLQKQVGLAQGVAYAVLQDLIKSFMDVQVGEYMVQEKSIYSAVPIKVLPQRRQTRQESGEKNKEQNVLQYKKQLELKQALQKEQQQKKVQVLESKQRPLNLKTRLAIKQMKEEDRRIGEEVAYVMEDLLHALDKGYNKVFRLGEYENAYKQQQKEKEREEQLQKEKEIQEFKRKRRLRAKQLKEFREKREQKKKAKEKEKEKHKYKGIAVIPEYEYNQNIMERKKKMKQKRMQPKLLVRQGEEYKEEQKEKRRQVIRAKREDRLRRKENFKEFGEQKIKEITEKFQEDKEEELKRKEEGEERARQEAKKQKYQKKVWVPKEITANNERIQLNQQNNTKIEAYFEQADIQSFFKKYEKQFQTIFKIYVQREYTPLNINGERSTMSLHSFLAFANDFQICRPNLANHNQFYQIYNSIIKSKPQQDHVQEGLSFKEFLQSLIRVCIKVDEVMARMESSLEGVPEEDQEEELLGDPKKALKKSILANQSRITYNASITNIIERNRNQFDHYHNIDSFDVKQLETLYEYFKLPEGTGHEIEKAVLQKPHQPKVYNRTQMNLYERKNGNSLVQTGHSLDNLSMQKSHIA